MKNQKLISKQLCKVLLISWLVIISGNSQALPILGYKFNYYAFKNIDTLPANDFHMEAITVAGALPGTFKLVGVRSPKDGGGVPAFPNKDFSTGPVHTMAWTSSENHIPIPPGGKMDVAISGNSPEGSKTFFTHDGDTLKTQRTVIYYEIVPTNPFSSNGNFIIKNPNLIPAIINQLEGFVDNIMDAFNFVPYQPTGSPVPGIPSSIILNPGDSVVYPYSSVDPLKYVSIHGVAALINDVNNTFEGGAVIKFVPETNSIPALSTWGIVVLFIVLAGAGFIFLRRMTY